MKLIQDSLTKGNELGKGALYFVTNMAGPVRPNSEPINGHFYSCHPTNAQHDMFTAESTCKNTRKWLYCGSSVQWTATEPPLTTVLEAYRHLKHREENLGSAIICVASLCVS